MLDPIGEYFASKHVGRSLWTLDVNRDGKQDFAVTHQTEPVALLVNHTESEGKWLRLDLRGTTDSRDAVGSVVRVQTSQSNRVAFCTSGSGYQCSNEATLHLGLGRISDTHVSVEVTWPSGQRQTIEQVPLNEQTLIVQDREGW